MRKLGYGQSVLILAPAETDRAIRKATRLHEGDSVEVHHVLRWAMLETCADKMDSLVAMQDVVNGRLDAAKRKETVIDMTFIEKERPVASATYATENPEDLLKGINPS